MYSGVRVISSCILHDICLLIGELANIGILVLDQLLLGEHHCIYMFICSELIEETERPPGLIFGMWIFSAWFGHFRVLEKNSSNCHIFESVKNHINADISHPT